MPESNNDFWGSWIENYSQENEVPSDLGADFKGFYCVYYEQKSVDYSGGRYVDVGTLKLTQQFGIKDGEVYLGNNVLTDTYYAVKAKDNYGQGIDGATRITVSSDGKFVFDAPSLYYPDPTGYDFEIVGYNFSADGTVESEINQGNEYLSWDIYGFFCLPKYGIDYLQTKYYIRFAEDSGIKIPEGKTAVSQNGFVYVHKDAFKAALYSSVTLSDKVTIKWDEAKGCFGLEDVATLPQGDASSTGSDLEVPTIYAFEGIDAGNGILVYDGVCYLGEAESAYILVSSDGTFSTGLDFSEVERMTLLTALSNITAVRNKSQSRLEIQKSSYRSGNAQ